jgi:hypothetical protein
LLDLDMVRGDVETADYCFSRSSSGTLSGVGWVR